VVFKVVASIGIEAVIAGQYNICTVPPVTAHLAQPRVHFGASDHDVFHVQLSEIHEPSDLVIAVSWYP